MSHFIEKIINSYKIIDSYNNVHTFSSSSSSSSSSPNRSSSSSSSPTKEMNNNISRYDITIHAPVASTTTTTTTTTRSSIKIVPLPPGKLHLM